MRKEWVSTLAGRARPRMGAITAKAGIENGDFHSLAAIAGFMPCFHTKTCQMFSPLTGWVGCQCMGERVWRMLIDARLIGA